MAVDRNGYTHGTDGKFTGHAGSDPDPSVTLSSPTIDPDTNDLYDLNDEFTQFGHQLSDITDRQLQDATIAASEILTCKRRPYIPGLTGSTEALPDQIYDINDIVSGWAADNRIKVDDDTLDDATHVATAILVSGKSIDEVSYPEPAVSAPGDVDTFQAPEFYDPRDDIVVISIGDQTGRVRVDGEAYLTVTAPDGSERTLRRAEDFRRAFPDGKLPGDSDTATWENNRWFITEVDGEDVDDGMAEDIHHDLTEAVVALEQRVADAHVNQEPFDPRYLHDDYSEAMN
jgi:hypothetical protein